ncbi:tyrosine-protein kinase-like otk [Drosophila mojavensis]|uniref:Ig-like domain-containing protein n=1 Tax=Drosophila mojavensis TaxID=7230 RepID=B4KPU1_DROMO|nr:tyrosine-protein kinase-like otk [Drosophila mojavensis]EDW10218.2 uncharacterized protein Dmoj_GI18648 [Drosophila mojavensis]
MIKSEIKVSRLLLLSSALILCSCSCVRGAPAAETDVGITQGPSGRITVKEQSPIQMPCVYQLPESYRQGNSVTLRWRKDGKPLRQVELGLGSSTTSEPQLETLLREDARLTLNKETGSLHFASVLASDAGVYQCQLLVEGQSAVTSGSGTLEVIEQLKFMPQPTSKNLELGSTSKVHCKAQGRPAPQVKWMRETQLPLPANVTDHNGTLIFRGVSNEQRGQYTCFASNSQGQINATVSINVVVAPKFTVPPAGPIEVSEGDVAVMHCQATGEPRPTIQWDKDLAYLNENNTDPLRFRLLDNGTLEIHDVQPEDEGRYGCTIGSSAGFKREDALLVVRGSKSASNSIVTRIIIVIICLAFLYFVLVLGLKLWYRYRRHMGKVQLDDAAHVAADADGHEHAEHEPCLTDANSSKNLKSKLRESTILEQESQVADDIV